MQVVRDRLLTPVGLRSLAPGHPDYKSKYYGDLRSRDAAYHQGTVWAWLIGPFVDAWLKVHPDDRAGARRLLEGFDAHLSDACVGSISEIFDADAPYVPRGCVAQAWSVAEVLRCLLKTVAREQRQRSVDSPTEIRASKQSLECFSSRTALNCMPMHPSNLDLSDPALGWNDRLDEALAAHARRRAGARPRRARAHAHLPRNDRGW